MRIIPNFSLTGFIGASSPLKNAAAGRLNTGVQMFAQYPFRVERGPLGQQRIITPECLNAMSNITRCGGGGTAITQDGGQLSFTGTQSHIFGTAGYVGGRSRARLTSTATAGSQLGWRNGTGGEARGAEGYICYQRIGVSTIVAGQRGLIGVGSSVAAPANINPLTDTSMAKIGLATADSTGNWRFICGPIGAVATDQTLDASFPVNNTDFLDIFINQTPNGPVHWEVCKVGTVDGAYAASNSGTFTTNLPLASQMVHRYANISNNATASATTLDWQILGIWAY